MCEAVMMRGGQQRIAPHSPTLCLLTALIREAMRGHLLALNEWFLQISSTAQAKYVVPGLMHTAARLVVQLSQRYAADGTGSLSLQHQLLPFIVVCLCMCCFVGHQSDVDVVSWHPNSHYVATGSSDRTVRVWDVSNGECHQSCRACSQRVLHNTGLHQSSVGVSVMRGTPSRASKWSYLTSPHLPSLAAHPRCAPMHLGWSTQTYIPCTLPSLACPVGVSPRPVLCPQVCACVC